MAKAPFDFSSEVRKFWPTSDSIEPAPETAATDIAIVTAYFDIGRGDWPHYAVSNQIYLQRFGWLAKLNNKMVIFTTTEFAQKVLDLRREAGREDDTVIFTLDDLFGIPEVRHLELDIAHVMSDEFRATTLKPSSPEYNSPRYVIINALKSCFVMTAINLGQVYAPQVAWLDFGYCKQVGIFDPDMPWRFDCKGKIHLVHRRPLSNAPIFRVQQTGAVFFQGNQIVAPVTAWPGFSNEVLDALTAMLACGIVDDDQTLMLMAYRRTPSNYQVVAGDPMDWAMALRKWNEGGPLASFTFGNPRWPLAMKIKRKIALPLTVVANFIYLHSMGS